jgi:tetratricopeptide (TPR) repeat protein
MYAEAGRYDRALQVTKAIKYTGNREQALAAIAVEYAKARRYDQALQVVKSIKSVNDGGEFFQAEALAAIALLCTKAEPAHQASQILDQVLKVAKPIEDEDDKAIALAEIASQYAVVGQKDKALQILNQALWRAETIASRTVVNLGIFRFTF